MAGSAAGEARIAEWRMRLADILDGLSDGITIVGEDCRIEFANTAAEKVFGMPRESLVGMHCDDPALGFWNEQGRPSLEEQLACCRGFEPGETMPVAELNVIRPGRETVAVLFGVSPLRDETGRFLGVINTYTDITERKRAEDSLRESEERYRRFVETSQEGVLAQDAQFRISFANEEIARMTGYPVEDLIGRPVIDFVFADDRAAFGEQMRRRMEGESSRYELRFVRSDGSPIWLRLSATPLMDRSGAFAGSFAMLTDVTESKEAERARHEKETFDASLLRLYELLGRADSYSMILAALLTEVPKTIGYSGLQLAMLEEDGREMLVLDVPGDSIKEAIEDILKPGEPEQPTPSSERFVPLPVKGDRMMEEVAEGTHVVVVEDALTDPRTNKEVVSAIRARTIVNVPLVLARKTIGALVMGTFGAEGVRLPSRGQLDYLNALSNHVAVAMDRVRGLEERERAQESLWESSQMLKLVLDNMPSFVFWKDRNSVYLGCNRLFALNAGFDSPEEVIGLTDLDLPWKDTEAAGYRADDRMVMETGISKINYEETQVTADGRLTDVRTSKVPLRNPEGDIIGVLGTFEDITESKQAERRVRESEARLHGIISNTNAAIHLTDSAGRLLLVNRKFAKLLGVDERQALGKTIREISPSKQLAEALQRRERQVLETGRSLQVEETLPMPDGRRTYVSLTFPLFDTSRAVYAVCGISTDITEMKQAEEELRNKDLAIRRAYVDVIAAVTGNRLILMTPDEIEDALGEPLSAPRRAIGYEELSGARADIRNIIREHVAGAPNLDDFIVAVGEGLTNAIKHGGGGWYQVRRRDETFQVVISDKGPGVDFTTVPRATLEAGFSTRGTLGMGYSIMLESSERLLLSTQPGETILVLEWVA